MTKKRYIAVDGDGNVVCRWTRSTKPQLPDSAPKDHEIKEVDEQKEVDYWADWTGV